MNWVSVNLGSARRLVVGGNGPLLKRTRVEVLCCRPSVHGRPRQGEMVWAGGARGDEERTGLARAVSVGGPTPCPSPPSQNTTDSFNYTGDGRPRCCRPRDYHVPATGASMASFFDPWTTASLPSSPPAHSWTCPSLEQRSSHGRDSSSSNTDATHLFKK